MSNPTNNAKVQFKYIASGASLPNPLDNNTIYFDENTQRLIVSGVSIYNPVVYNSSPQLAPKTILLTQEQYNNLRYAVPTQIDEDTLYLIYRSDFEDEP